MDTLGGLRQPIEFASQGAHRMGSELQQVGRNEWWLWFWALVATVLSTTGLFLSFFRSLFVHRQHFYEISSDQARWGILSLLLLFNGWLLYRQWVFRRARKEADEQSTGADAPTETNQNPTQMDALTGLYTRASADHRLGKEVARARRWNLPLSLVALHLDDLAQVNEHFGKDASDKLVAEVANRLRKASRGSDFCVRLGKDDFLIVLPECSLAGAKRVSDRVGTVNIKSAGEEMNVSYSVGWIDYKPGEVPSDLFKRAGDVLKLYKDASNDTSFETAAAQKSRLKQPGVSLHR
jgi:diguanylate cyclase (GGDEF)-like protein